MQTMKTFEQHFGDILPTSFLSCHLSHYYSVEQNLDGFLRVKRLHEEPCD